MNEELQKRSSNLAEIEHFLAEMSYWLAEKFQLLVEMWQNLRKTEEVCLFDQFIFPKTICIESGASGCVNSNFYMIENILMGKRFIIWRNVKLLLRMECWTYKLSFVKYKPLSEDIQDVCVFHLSQTRVLIFVRLYFSTI